MNVWAMDLSSGEMIHASKARRGNACDCVCIGCGRVLQARKGKERIPHFKHIGDVECGKETITHKLVKEILSRNNRFMLPDGQGYFFYQNTSTEQKLPNLRPDIILHGHMDLHVEVAVTSFITERKFERIHFERYPTIEIDASEWDLLETYQELENAVIHGKWDKEIIYWPVSSEATPVKKSFEWVFAIAGSIVLLMLGYWLRPDNLKTKNRTNLKY